MPLIPQPMANDHLQLTAGGGMGALSTAQVGFAIISPTIIIHKA